MAEFSSNGFLAETFLFRNVFFKVTFLTVTLNFSYVSLNLPPFVPSAFLLYNCHCIMALSFDSAKKITLLSG